MTSVMIQRRDAAQATLDHFRDKPFTWGKADCVRLVAFNLRKLGYRPSLAKGGAYSSEAGARRALKAAGFARLESTMDSIGLPRIGHASCLAGDIVAITSGEDWPALGVALGNGRVLAFNVHTGLAGVCAPDAADVVAAWKADPCLKPH